MTTRTPRTPLAAKRYVESLLSRFVGNDESDRRRALMIAAVIAGHLPFVAWHLLNLWQKKHYQFFPFVIVGIGWLVRIRRLPSRHDSPRLEPRIAHLLPGLIVLCAAALLFSAWLAAVAAILAAGGVLWSLAGRDRWRQWAPVWALLWLLVPAPLGWDDDLVFMLQSIASRASSATLDVLGVRHLLDGHVLELPGHRLLVEEACSGINSLFLLLAATAMFVVASRRPVLWAVLLLAGSVVWAVLVNVGRIAAVVLAQSWWDVDLTAGWVHTILGFSVIAIALLMLASTDRLLAYLLGRIDLRAGHFLDSWYDNEPAANRLVKAWNWCVELSGPEAAPSNSVESRRERTGRQNSRRTRRLVIGCFVMLAALQLAALVSFKSRPFVVHRAPFLRSDLFDGFDLPNAIDGWFHVESVEQEHNDGISSGVYSKTWHYRSSFCVGSISVDYPFSHWHDLSCCYAAQGWTIKDRAVHFSAAKSGLENDPFVEVTMTRPGGRSALLLFSMFDEQGHARIRSDEVTLYHKCLRNLNEHPLRWLLEGKALTNSTFQVQAFLSSAERLSANERRAGRELFFTARHEIVSAYRARQQRIFDD